MSRDKRNTIFAVCLGVIAVAVGLFGITTAFDSDITASPYTTPTPETPNFKYVASLTDSIHAERFVGIIMGYTRIDEPLLITDESELLNFIMAKDFIFVTTQSGLNVAIRSNFAPVGTPARVIFTCTVRWLAFGGVGYKIIGEPVPDYYDQEIPKL